MFISRYGKFLIKGFCIYLHQKTFERTVARRFILKPWINIWIFVHFLLLHRILISLHCRRECVIIPLHQITYTAICNIIIGNNKLWSHVGNLLKQVKSKDKQSACSAVCVLQAALTRYPHSKAICARVSRQRGDVAAAATMNSSLGRFN